MSAYMFGFHISLVGRYRREIAHLRATIDETLVQLEGIKYSNNPLIDVDILYKELRRARDERMPP